MLFHHNKHSLPHLCHDNDDDDHHHCHAHAFDPLPLGFPGVTPPNSIFFIVDSPSPLTACNLWKPTCNQWNPPPLPKSCVSSLHPELLPAISNGVIVILKLDGSHQRVLLVLESFKLKPNCYQWNQSTSTKFQFLIIKIKPGCNHACENQEVKSSSHRDDHDHYTMFFCSLFTPFPPNLSAKKKTGTQPITAFL